MLVGARSFGRIAAMRLTAARSQNRVYCTVFHHDQLRCRSRVVPKLSKAGLRPKIAGNSLSGFISEISSQSSAILTQRRPIAASCRASTSAAARPRSAHCLTNTKSSASPFEAFAAIRTPGMCAGTGTRSFAAPRLIRAVPYSIAAPLSLQALSALARSPACQREKACSMGCSTRAIR